jgi:hypothetical protein
VVAGVSIDLRWQDLTQVLRETRMFLAQTDADFTWSGWRDQTAALSEWDGVISSAEARTLDVADIAYFFAPTGSLQEVSLSSGCADAFLKLAARFDKASKGL